MTQNSVRPSHIPFLFAFLQIHRIDYTPTKDPIHTKLQVYFKNISILNFIIHTENTYCKAVNLHLYTHSSCVCPSHDTRDPESIRYWWNKSLTAGHWPFHNPHQLVPNYSRVPLHTHNHTQSRSLQNSKNKNIGHSCYSCLTEWIQKIQLYSINDGFHLRGEVINKLYRLFKSFISQLINGFFIQKFLIKLNHLCCNSFANAL